MKNLVTFLILTQSEWNVTKANLKKFVEKALNKLQQLAVQMRK